jgi:hypothetical protein
MTVFKVLFFNFVVIAGAMLVAGDASAITCSNSEARPRQPCGGINALTIHLIVNRFRQQETYNGCFPTFHDTYGTAKLLRNEGDEETYLLQATGYFIDQVPFEFDKPREMNPLQVVFNRRTAKMRVVHSNQLHGSTYPQVLVCQ